MEKTMIYLHIPFCVKKCRYCDFLSFPGMEREMMDRYAKAIEKEIRLLKESGELKENTRITSLFVGGGTPSILETRYAAKIASACRDVFDFEKDAEITIEVNPGTVSDEKAKAWKEMGINRVSMGVQSLEDELLIKLGRIHRLNEVERSYDILRKAGFDNINFDLMSGLPGQSMEMWMKTLREAVSMEPEHLSCYSLIIEEGTPLYEEQDSLDLPDEETERAMYREGAAYLREEGYDRYEISNYSKKGYESRHNIGYWRRKPYFGLGLGAASLTADQTRYNNTRFLQTYLEAAESGGSMTGIREDVCKLGRKEQMEEFMFLGLRCASGISSDEFERIFGLKVENVYKEALGKHLKNGLLIREGNRYRLTDRGIDLSNQVFVDMLQD